MRTNPLREQIAQIARTEIGQIMKPVKGKVVQYSNKHNYAQVEIDNPYGPGTLLLEYVPVQIIGGFHAPGPFPGDEVWVDFTAGKINMPKIVAFADRLYKSNTREKKFKHKKQGAFLPDRLSRRR
jgi:hypothetical protein